MPEQEVVKIAVVGSRTFGRWAHFEATLKQHLLEHHSDKKIILVSGGARGVDSMAEWFAKMNDMEIVVIKPDYHKYPKKIAPMIRNGDIIKEADEIVAFWKGNSPGTRDVIEKAQKAKKKTVIYYVDE